MSARELTVYEALAQLPVVNSEDEIEPLPASLQALLSQVGLCEALLLVCPPI